MNSRILHAAAIVIAAAALCRPAFALTDADIGGIVSVANQGEIDAAQTAIGKAQDAAVKKFAQHMATDHGDAKIKLAAVLEKASVTPSDTEASNDLKKHSVDEAAALDAATGADFDKAYMDAQVADHAGLLKKLDGELIPSAQDPGLKAFLSKTRGVVAHHLAMARRLRAKVAAKP